MSQELQWAWQYRSYKKVWKIFSKYWAQGKSFKLLQQIPYQVYTESKDWSKLNMQP